MKKEMNQPAKSWLDNDTSPFPHQIQINDQHRLRTDGQAREKEEEEEGVREGQEKTISTVHVLTCKKSKVRYTVAAAAKAKDKYLTYK